MIGADILLDEASVTGTENAVMAAVLAQGTTIFRNAASEPHVQDLCRCLVQMGARIEGIGSNMLTIHGVDRLNGAEFTHRRGLSRSRQLYRAGGRDRRRDHSFKTPARNIWR